MPEKRKSAFLRATQEAQGKTIPTQQQTDAKPRQAKKKTVSFYLDDEHINKLDDLEAAFLSRHRKIYRNDIVRHLIKQCNLDDLLHELAPEE